MEFRLTPLFFLPLVAGYIFIKEWERTRYLIVREGGHKLYFRSAFWGLICTIILLLICVLIEYLIPTSFIANIATGVRYHLSFLVPLTFTKLVIISLVSAPIFAYVVAKLLNVFTDEYKHFYDALKLNEFEYLLIMAIKNSHMIMATMEEGKVYVGWPYKTSDPGKGERKYFSIIPAISSYRDDKGEVQFTTEYTSVYEKTEDKLEHFNIFNFELVLPVSRVCSIRIFDSEAFDEFNSVG